MRWDWLRRDWTPTLYLSWGGLVLAVAVLDLVQHRYWSAFSNTLLAVVFLSFLWARRIWIGIGRNRARDEMIHSVSEAHRRGLAYQDWLLGELERDTGITLPPHPEEGSS